MSKGGCSPQPLDWFAVEWVLGYWLFHLSNLAGLLNPRYNRTPRSVGAFRAAVHNSNCTAALSLLLGLRKLLGHLFVIVGELFVGGRCFPCLLGKIFAMGLHRHR